MLGKADRNGSARFFFVSGKYRFISKFLKNFMQNACRSGKYTYLCIRV